MPSLGKDEIKYPDSVFSKSFEPKPGERFLRLEVALNASLDAVWHSFSTEDIETWMAPVSQLDFEIGGEMKNHMNYKTKIGDQGTLTLGIIYFIPREIITHRVHLDKYFGEQCARRIRTYKRWYNLFRLTNKTMIVSTTMDGAQDQCGIRPIHSL